MKKIIVILIAGVMLAMLLAGCSQPAEEPGGHLPSADSAGFTGSGFVWSGAVVPMESGYMDEKEIHLPEIEEPKYKTIGTFSQSPSVKRTLLLNLTGKDIIGFAVKPSTETEFANKLLLEGDVFVLDEIREIFFDPSPVKEPETQAATTAGDTTQAAPANGTETPTTAPETQAQPETAAPAADSNQKFDVQITFSDWSVYVIHDLPFDDMKLGRLLLQNDILFLEYTSEETGEEVITRKQEYDIKAAEWQAYQQQLAQQQAQQQAWQQQQQQQNAAPATNNDAGCIGDAGLMW